MCALSWRSTGNPHRASFVAGRAICAAFASGCSPPDNADVLLRRFRSGAFESALLAIDGMTDSREIDENILKPCMDLPGDAGKDIAEGERIAFLMAHAVSILPIRFKTNMDDIIADALSGQWRPAVARAVPSPA